MVFRASSIALLAVVCLNALLNIFPGHISVLLVGVWLGFSFRGMASMKSQVFGRVYWRGYPKLNAVALTFDDGPTVPSTALVLDLLKKHNVKATFFVIGRNIVENQGLAARIHAEGHEFGNHSFSHPWVFKMKFASIREDIELCQAEIEKVAGYRPLFFRQPIGLNNPAVMNVVSEMGMDMVGWQARAYDAVRVSREHVVSRVLGSVKPGGIIMLHDGHDGRSYADRGATIAALEDIIVELKGRGWEFKTVSELVGVENRQGVGGKGWV